MHTGRRDVLSCGDRRKTREKISCGIKFIQTQTVFDVEQYKDFFEKTKHLPVTILPGVSVIKSVK
ncbi:MAG: methylenetetrahydrofolate reductase, partial [Clostridia bacterium]|nr:methylenetetrahydrofolate reductase [Clostridia bacterium]